MDSESFAPTIDITSPTAVEELDAACRQAGFFQIVGHGIAPETVTSAMDSVKAFFRLPVEEKVKWIASDQTIERGYSARGTEAFAYSMDIETPNDLVEAFTVGQDSFPADDPIFNTTEHTHFAQNIWPDRPEELRGAVLAYYDEVRRATHEVTRLLAEALELDTDFFERTTTHPMDSLRFNYYFGSPDDPEPLPGQFGVGPHTDYGLITVMYADGVNGLQVADSEGQWHEVVPISGALVVNLGDLMAQWTNDRWRSSLHRVKAMRPENGRLIERLSAPFFHSTSYDTVIECLPTCVSDTNPARYPTVIAGEQFDAKFIAARVLEAADQISTVGDRNAALQADLV
jgi:isopenicillin N synthase-like dioxygenase